MVRTPTARKPQVGIWWLVGRTLVAFTQDVDGLATDPVAADADLSHMRVWREVVRRFPSLRGKGYESIPRGRVVKRGTTYLLLVPTAKSASVTLKRRLVSRFRLGEQSARVLADEHYDPPHPPASERSTA